MAVDIISSIRETEMQAQKIKDDAQTKVKLLEKEAELAGKKLVEETADEARQSAEKMINDARLDAENKINKNDGDLAAQKKAITDSAKNNLSKAVDYIIGELRKL